MNTMKDYRDLFCYDSDKTTSYKTSLYGHCMMNLLPTEIYDQVNPKDFNLDNYSNDSPIGCFLEVVLDYPYESHNLHNDHPLAGEKIEVRKEMLSKYQL